MKFQKQMFNLITPIKISHFLKIIIIQKHYHFKKFLINNIQKVNSEGTPDHKTQQRIIMCC